MELLKTIRGGSMIIHTFAGTCKFCKQTSDISRRTVTDHQATVNHSERTVHQK